MRDANVLNSIGWVLGGCVLFAMAEALGLWLRGRPRTLWQVARDNWLHIAIGGTFGAVMAGMLRVWGAK